MVTAGQNVKVRQLGRTSPSGICTLDVFIEIDIERQ